MWQLTKANTEMKLETLNKRWNWSSWAKLVLSASWTTGLIAQSVRASKRNSVFVGSNPSQANFLELLQRIRQWWIPYIYIYDYLKKICGDWRRQRPKWNLTLSKQWRWSGCTMLALSASWTHGLIAQWSWIQIPRSPTFYNYFRVYIYIYINIYIYIYIYIYICIYI